MRLRTGTGLALVALTMLALPGAAAAQESPYPDGPFAPWDGSNPFQCANQDVGTGVDFPDPGADPFCVEFDKTQQNLTDLGLLAFLANEPARVAAALDKCFYFQHDHWTGSIVQGEAPELWHWDGSYVIDRGSGAFGANLQNFRILGAPASPSAYFPIPAEYASFFDQDGIGGILVLGQIPVDPLCAAKVDTPEERDAVYRRAPVLPGAGLDPGASLPPQTPALSGATAAPGPVLMRSCRRAKKRKRGARPKRRCRRGKTR
jgi:hypothetical protein